MMPKELEKGDKIAIISPASQVKAEYVTGAMETIRLYGYEPVMMPHVLGPADGSFAASKSARLADLVASLKNPEVKAILCARGGYGCCQLLSDVPKKLVARFPKWLIGFSDISALHALWLHDGVASIHGPMAKHLATLPNDDYCTQELFRILENGGRFDYKVDPHPYNITGTATGRLMGGNLAVLNDLAETPYDILDVSEDNDIILFLEDISEPIYKVNRMLWRLLLSDTLRNVKGIIFGQFTEYKPDANYKTMADMLRDFFDEAGLLPAIPIVYNFPSGHCDDNLPLVEGAHVDLTVTDSGVRLRTLH